MNRNQHLCGFGISLLQINGNMRFCHLLCGGLELGVGGAPKSPIISILWLWKFPGMAASNCNSMDFEILKESLASYLFVYQIYVIRDITSFIQIRTNMYKAVYVHDCVVFQ